MNLRNSTKRAVMATDKLMILILVVFTIVLVLIIVFRVDINNLIRNLPGYSLPEDEEIEIVFLSFTYFSTSRQQDFNCSYAERVSLGETYKDAGLPDEKESFKYFRNGEYGNPRPTIVGSDGEEVYYYNGASQEWTKLNSTRDIVLDEEIEGVCPRGFVGKINVPEGGFLGIGEKQFISINGVKTNLFWKAGEEEGEVKVKSGGKNEAVAEVVNGKVSLDSELFIEMADGRKFFNYNSDIYKKIEEAVDVSDLVKIHSSYYGGNNFICVGTEEEIITEWGELEEIPLVVSCSSDTICVNVGYKYCVKGFCESGQIGSLCENDGDCDKETCVKRQEADRGFCGYARHSNCEEFIGEGGDSCYCEGCGCGEDSFFEGEAIEMVDGTVWVCNDIFEYIMPQLGSLAPCYVASVCESEEIIDSTFDLDYGGKSFEHISRCKEVSE